MNRCISRLLAVLLMAAAGSLVTSWPLTATAQTEDAKPGVRAFPKTAVYGEMTVQNHPVITIDGKAEQLSPGARIFDQQNYLVLSGRLVNQTLPVNYLRDGSGQIYQVWILNAEELKDIHAASRGSIFDFLFRKKP
ncbi:MAG: hypothetical protein ABIP46_01780 [Polaromonas sp.]